MQGRLWYLRGPSYLLSVERLIFFPPSDHVMPIL